MKQTIFITGSSSGIGKETARYFQARGWNVVASMRQPENEKDLSLLDNVLVTKLDVLDSDTIKSAFREAIQRFGKIDVLLNNAGYGAYGSLESFSKEGIVRQFHTNVIGLLEVTQTFLPHFRENKSGMVINISSMGGKIAFPLGSLYHGTKFAVEGISEALSFELEQIGGKMKIVEPGVTATEFGGRSFDFSHNPELQEYQKLVEVFMAALPEMVKNASPAEKVASVIFEAATDGSNKLRYVAGLDASTILDNRRSNDDESFREIMKSQFGL